MDTDRGRQKPDQTTEALYEQRQWLQVTLSSIGDAVITTDAEGKISFLNPVAQALTGWTQEEAAGTPLDIVFKIVNEETRDTVENPATRALREGLVVGLANHTLLIAKDGAERPIDDLRHQTSSVSVSKLTHFRLNISKYPRLTILRKL